MAACVWTILRGLTVTQVKNKIGSKNPKNILLRQFLIKPLVTSSVSCFGRDGSPFN
jgi:hypothetical protein